LFEAIWQKLTKYYHIYLQEGPENMKSAMKAEFWKNDGD
jgi:hypothetical protein